MDVVRDAIRATLRDADLTTLEDDTPLGTIAGWDSMAAMEVLMAIEDATGSENLEVVFSGQTTISDIRAALRGLGVEL